MTSEQADNEPKWPLEKQIEFHLKEYEQLKSEIARLDAAKRSLQIYTVGAIAGVIAWLVANRDAINSLEARFAWWLPLFVAVMGAMLSRTYVRSTKEIGGYIAKLEKMSAHPSLGWESAIGERRQTRGSLTSYRESLIWLIILAMCLVVGVTFGLSKDALRTLGGVIS